MPWNWSSVSCRLPASSYQYSLSGVSPRVSLCEPSQNGWFFDRPHLHSQTSLPSSTYFVGSCGVRLTSRAMGSFPLGWCEGHTRETLASDEDSLALIGT